MAIEEHDTASEDQRVNAFVSEVAEDLHAGTLPLRIFNDETVFEAELNRIFGETWEFIGHESEIPEPGDYALRYIGNDPFIFIRDEETGVQVLFNSCRHRGTRICRAEQGNTTHFRCPYHGWTYNNRGDLVGVPKKHEAFEDLDITKWGLKGAPRVETHSGLVFASLNPDVPSLEEYIGDFAWYIDSHMKLTTGGMEVVGEPQRWRIDSNWKIGTENTAGDDYHTHITHKSALDAGAINADISWEGETYYETVCDVNGHTTMYRVFSDKALEAEGSDADTFYSYPDEVKDNLNYDELTDGQIEVARKSTVTVGNLFPNFGFVHHAATQERGKPEIGFFSIFKFQPISPTETEVWFWILAPEEASDEYKERAYSVGAAWDGTTGNVGQDDTAVWKGITSSAGSKFAEKSMSEINYQMGVESDPNNQPDVEWPGPGTAYRGHHDGHARTFYNSWHTYMEQ